MFFLKFLLSIDKSIQGKSSCLWVGKTHRIWRNSRRAAVGTTKIQAKRFRLRFSDALGSVNLFLKMKAEEYCKQYSPLFLSRTLILKYVLLLVRLAF